jgi:hypothetical protein
MANLRTNPIIPHGGLTWKVNRMITQKILLVFLFIAAATPAAHAQIDCNSSSASNKLSCLIPTTVTPSGYTFSKASPNPLLQNSFGFLTSDIGGEISQIPLASPASGIVFITDPTLHVPVPSDQSLGPILTQRADTIGRHKLYAAMTYQYFLLEDVDGLGLKGLPTAAFYLNSSATSGTDTIALVNGRIDLKIHQYVGYATFGLTDRVDVSVAVPLLRVDMRYTVNEHLYNTNGQSLPLVGSSACSPGPPGPPCAQTNPLQNSKPEEATGIGDVILAFKAEPWKAKHAGLAFGAEVRLPTGDAENFLGSGTVGVKPFVTFTRSGKISPHLNVGYQFNGDTELVTNSAGQNALLPSRLLYSGGADWGVAKRLTFALDVLEQRVINSKRATTQLNVAPFPSTSNLTVTSVITSTSGSYNRTDGSIGFKLKPFGNLLITSNLLVKLDKGGLRERLAPLVGLSYTF